MRLIPFYSYEVKVIHREAKCPTRVIYCQLSNDPPKIYINMINISPSLLLRPKLMPIHVVLSVD